MNWNYDISEARGIKTVTRPYTARNGVRSTYDIEEPIKIIGCVDTEEQWVAVTYWLPPANNPSAGIIRKEGRWAGLTSEQELLAWMPMPDHPMKLTT